MALYSLRHLSLASCGAGAGPVETSARASLDLESFSRHHRGSHPQTIQHAGQQIHHTTMAVFSRDAESWPTWSHLRFDVMLTLLTSIAGPMWVSQGLLCRCFAEQRLGSLTGSSTAPARSKFARVNASGMPGLDCDQLLATWVRLTIAGRRVSRRG